MDRGFIRQISGGCLQIIGGGILFSAALASLITLALAKMGNISWYSVLIVGAIVVVSMLAGALCYGFGTDWRIETADELMAKDPRPPVLYLRSFEFDSPASTDLHAPLPVQDAALGFALQTVSQKNYEQILVDVFTRIGPCIAVGKPGHEAPITGFARKKLQMESWQSEVKGFMEKAALVVICSGNTEGVLWELKQAKGIIPLDRLLILITQDTSEGWWRAAENIFGQKIPRFTDNTEQAVQGLFYFDDGIMRDEALFSFERSLIEEKLSVILARLQTGHF